MIIIFILAAVFITSASGNDAEKPQQLIIRPLSTSLMVSWLPPTSSEGPVERYLLGYGAGVPDAKVVQLPGNTLAHRLSRLEPGTQYFISVRAVTVAGVSPAVYTDAVTHSTPTCQRAAPVLPPVGLEATTLGPHTILVTWSGGVMSHDDICPAHNATPTYVVRASQTIPAEPGYVPYRRFIRTNRPRAVIHGLTPHVHYTFEVQIVVGERESIWSMAAGNSTTDAAPSSPPRRVTVKVIQGSKVRLKFTWRPPRYPNGDITAYTIHRSESESREPDSLWFLAKRVRGGRRHTFINSNITSGHYWSVRAWSRKGSGPLAPPIRVTLTS